MNSSDNSSTPQAAEHDDVVLKLESFLPYQLSLASNTISAGIADLYEKRFKLSIPQWRAMAVIGRFDGLSARDVAERTAMDKVAVSRALKRLETAGYLHRRMSTEDRRRSVLRLTREGRTIYDQIAPIAVDYETRLLEVLQPSERDALTNLLERLMHHARTL
ncbi:MAG: MarR family winged helix-turn-helix transcriptional regulator [Gammaproteobacteria bacterium]